MNQFQILDLLSSLFNEVNDETNLIEVKFIRKRCLVILEFELMKQSVKKLFQDCEKANCSFKSVLEKYQTESLIQRSIKEEDKNKLTLVLDLANNSMPEFMTLYNSELHKNNDNEEKNLYWDETYQNYVNFQKNFNFYIYKFYRKQVNNFFRELALFYLDEARERTLISIETDNTINHYEF